MMNWNMVYYIRLLSLQNPLKKNLNLLVSYTIPIIKLLLSEASQFLHGAFRKLGGGGVCQVLHCVKTSGVSTP